MKEDQEFDKQMTKNKSQNTTNWKLDIEHVSYSDTKSLFDLWVKCSNEMKYMIQIKRHSMSAARQTYKETKPIEDLFQKPLFADNCRY